MQLTAIIISISSYVYAKETMGQYAAVIAGACLTLEYTGSAGAVASKYTG